MHVQYALLYFDMEFLTTRQIHAAEKHFEAVCAGLDQRLIHISTPSAIHKCL